MKIITNKISLRGEFTLVIGNEETNYKKNITDIVKKQTLKLLEKYTLTETVKIVHKLSNISKKDIYQMALKIKND